MADLSDFFKLVAEDKKKKKEEFDAIVGDLNLNSIFEEVTTLKKKNKVKKKKEEKTLEAFENWLYSDNIKKKPIEEVQEVVEDVIEEVQEIVDNILEETKEEPTLIEKSLGLLAEPSNVKVQKDPLTPLDQNFATLEDLQNHYKLFISRIQQQLSTLGGSGETRLEFLDDVDRNSAKRDNYFLKYDATINKWVGDDGGGVGITSIVFITGVTTYYSATRDVDYIGVSADVPVTIDLPINPAAGKQIIIKDEGNKISTYNITVRAGIGASVENDSSVIMKINHESFTYFYNGYNWYIV
ncbi:MAG: hypothetical protein EBU90_02800 [Proteobacteria bacterium]|nr:hypothetical protein [Pseudomonadota bacterium]